jgi:cytochrome oxidase Cu insertion factor (SCO1/SenC/PrrC family)
MRLLLAVALVSVLVAGCTQPGVQSHPEPEPDPRTGEAPVGPAWSFVDTDGQARGRDDALGGPAAIFFMATWCGKCQVLAPRLGGVAAEYEARGLSMHTVSWDPQEDDADLQDWKARYGHDWPHGVDAGSRIAQTFDITRQSSLVILDGQGHPVRTWIYATPSAADLRAALDEALARTGSTGQA